MTFVECDYGIRIWNHAAFDEPVKGKVELRGNLLFECTRADMDFIVQPKMSYAPVGDREAIVKRWFFSRNREQVSKR